VIADSGSNDGDGCFTDLKLNQPLLADHFGSPFEPLFQTRIRHQNAPSLKGLFNED
jgi:hypothetical protein